MDLRDAHRDAHRQRRRLFHKQLHRQGQVRQRRPDELRGASHFAGMDHLNRFDRPDLRRLIADHPEPRRRYITMVEASHHHLLRNACRRHNP